MRYYIKQVFSKLYSKMFYGKITSKVVPEFALSLTKMLPSCTLTISWTNARPRPTPPRARLLDLSRRKKGSKIRSLSSSGIPFPVSSTARQICLSCCVAIFYSIFYKIIDQPVDKYIASY